MFSLQTVVSDEARTRLDQAHSFKSWFLLSTGDWKKATGNTTGEAQGILVLVLMRCCSQLLCFPQPEGETRLLP